MTHIAATSLQAYRPRDLTRQILEICNQTTWRIANKNIRWGLAAAVDGHAAMRTLAGEDLHQRCLAQAFQNSI